MKANFGGQFWLVITAGESSIEGPARKFLVRTSEFGFNISRMGKKTSMSDSSLWIIAIILVVIAAWTYFKH